MCVLTKTLCSSSKSSVCESFLSVLCPVNPICLCLSELSASSPQLRESSRLCLDSFLMPKTENSLKIVNWGSCRAHLICFLSFRDNCSSFPDIKSLEKHCLIYFVWSFWLFLGGRVNSVRLIHLGWNQKAVSLYLQLFMYLWHSLYKWFWFVIFTYSFSAI